MTKWEYLTVTASSHRDELKPNLVNGRELRDWTKGPNISDYINQLGYQGWELVTVDGWNYYFRRPKP